MNSSCMVRWIRARDPAIQVCPVAAKMPETTPFTASSKIGIIEDDVGRFASELKRNLLMLSRRAGRRARPCGRRP